jgi:hypothetical protein
MFPPLYKGFQSVDLWGQSQNGHITTKEEI